MCYSSERSRGQPVSGVIAESVPNLTEKVFDEKIQRRLGIVEETGQAIEEMGQDIDETRQANVVNGVVDDADILKGDVTAMTFDVTLRQARKASPASLSTR